MAKQSNFTIANYNAVLEAVKANNGYVVDTHGGSRGPYRAAGIAALVKGERVTPVLLCHGSYFCLNSLHKEADGSVTLSSWSVGGTIFTHQHGGLEEAIQAYNKEQSEWALSGGQLMHVRIFDYTDETAPVFGEPVDLAGEVVGALAAQEPIAKVDIPAQ